MSAMGGAYYFDEAPVDVGLAPVLETQLTRLGPDGVAHIAEQSIMMVYRAFHTTPESHWEHQPVQTPRFWLTFDGRLDNREELSEALGHITDTETDAGLAKASFEAWGLGCFSKWIGDFAAVIWDRVARELIMARDPFGVRALYFHRNSRRVIWSSAIEALLHCWDVGREFDDMYMLSYLIADVESSRTPFREITPVLPGHIVRIRSGSIQMDSFWRLELSHSKTHRKNDLEYEEMFKQLLFKAVKSRLRADRPVVAQLSGGLDSSSIACLANEIVRGKKAENDLATLSFVFGQARTADERRYIQIVEEKLGKPGFHLLEDEDPILGRWPDHDFIAFPSPIFCFGGRIEQIMRTMQEANARVLLSGWGGDQLLLAEGELLELADLLRAGRLLSLAREVLRWAKAEKRGALELFWNASIKPNISPLSDEFFPVPDWINVGELQRHVVSKRAVPPHMKNELGRLPSKWRQYYSLTLTVDHTASGYGAYPSSRRFIEMRYPFLHRPLVEFLFSTPTHQLLRPGERRSLQRRALRGILPEEIRLRRSKSGPDQAVGLAINRAWKAINDLVSTSRSAALGFVDQKTLLNEFQRSRHGIGRNLQQILRFISLEMWFRNFEIWNRENPIGRSTRPYSSATEIPIERR
jgi:asparagine synthase (glutamine-hydrolysing)